MLLNSKYLFKKKLQQDFFLKTIFHVLRTLSIVRNVSQWLIELKEYNKSTKTKNDKSIEENT